MSVKPYNFIQEFSLALAVLPMSQAWRQLIQLG